MRRWPGLGFSVLVGERIEVERRCQPPLPIAFVEKAVVLQMVVDVGDERITSASSVYDRS
jgi:hypothetical protein